LAKIFRTRTRARAKFTDSNSRLMRLDEGRMEPLPVKRIAGACEGSAAVKV
jgi:hypothetical protein